MSGSIDSALEPPTRASSRVRRPPSGPSSNPDNLGQSVNAVLAASTQHRERAARLYSKYDSAEQVLPFAWVIGFHSQLRALVW
jgi:hypothetical protein